jgi:energy-converting hydrogenase A subunit P
VSNISFVQKSNLFKFDATSCLRNEYYYNNCTLCVELCPKNAFAVSRNKLKLFEEDCIECAACIGICPSEALEIESFDANEYCAKFSESDTKELSCKNETPCLSVFDKHHFISMVLDSKDNITCNLSFCNDCDLNKDNIVKNSIEKRVDSANIFLEHISQQKVIKKFDSEAINEKRMLFKKAYATITNEKKEYSFTKEQKKTNSITTTLKNYKLNTLIKEYIPSLESTKFDTPHGLFFDKNITFSDCTNCGDCVQFCPTKSLIASKDKQGILFQSSLCIGCEICNNICKTNAVSTNDEFDLVEIAYDRVKELVHYEMVMCHECRTPYPYRGGDPICDRCQSFFEHSPDMFTLAKDM